MDNLFELLKLAQNFEANEIISIAKGKYQFPKNLKQILKIAKQWRLKK
jgi:putative N-acetylmannosamine-6-phosphate epimerase